MAPKKQLNPDEILVGQNKIGMSTSISLSVKTLFYFFALLFTFLTTLFGWFYFQTIERENNLKIIINNNFDSFKRDEIVPMRNQIFDLAKGQGIIQTDIKSVINKQLDLPTNNIQEVSTTRTNTPIGPR